MPTIRDFARTFAEAKIEALKKTNPDRSIDEWVEGVFIPRITDYFCYAANKEYYEALLDKARSGDDESIFKLVKVFKNIKHELPFIMERCRRAEREKDLEFEKKYAEAIQAPMRHENTNFPLLFHLILYKEFVEKRTAGEVREFFKTELGLEVKEDEKTFARYCQRMGLHTGQGKRGKRKNVQVLKPQNKPEKTFKEIGKEEGISGERARQVFRTAITKLEEHKKNIS